MKNISIIYYAPIELEKVECLYKSILDKVEAEDTVHLLLWSRGGDALLALGMARFLHSLPCTIYTYNMANVDSAAIFLFACGAQRYCTNGSRFLTHPLGISIKDQVQDAQSLQRLRARMEQETASLTGYLEERTGSVAAIWREFMDSSRCLSGKEALQLGLIHGFKNPPPVDTQHSISIC